MAKKRLVSPTERIALETGTVGFEGSLTNGNPDWKLLADLQDDTLTDEEQAFLDGPVDEFCDMLDDWAIHNSDDKDMPPEAWEFAKKNGFFGLVIPKEYGGKGFSALLHSAVVMKLASRSISAAINVMVPNSLGPGELIAHYGTQEQKDKYLKRLATGQDIPCFGLTEPEAGSDATSLRSKGVVEEGPDGQPVIRIKNLEKRYITLAPIATLLGIAYDLEDPKNLLGKGENPGITLSVIPRDTPGLEVGNRLRPMDVSFKNGTIRGDITIPVDSIIGGQDNAGQGWRMLMEALSIGRSISLPSLSVAGMKTSAYVAGAYAAVRKQFGLSVGKFEGIEEAIARIAGLSYLSDATRISTARMVDNGEKPVIPSAIAKYHLTENLRTAIDDAMDILAGKAVISGPGNPINRVYQALPIAITVEGANIMTRNMIIFGQGGVRTHKRILKTLNAMEDGKTLTFLGQGIGMVADTLVRAVQTFMPSMFHNSIPSDVDSKNKKYYRHINRLSAGFNMAVNTSFMLLQTDLKRKERLSARLGDVMSNLYMASAALQKFENDGRPEEDRVLLEWSVRHSLSEAEQAFDDLIRNFPNPVAAFFLRGAVFPFYQMATRRWKPDDKLDHKVAQTILNPGDVRERLTDGIYKPADADKDSVAAFNAAFHKTAEADAILRAARKAGIDPADIPADKLAIVDAARAAAKSVIAVDEFENDGRTPYRLAMEVS